MAAVVTRGRGHSVRCPSEQRLTGDAEEGLQGSDFAFGATQKHKPYIPAGLDHAHQIVRRQLVNVVEGDGHGLALLCQASG